MSTDDYFRQYLEQRDRLARELAAFMRTWKPSEPIKLNPVILRVVEDGKILSEGRYAR